MRHEAGGLLSVIDADAADFRHRGMPLAQEILAGGHVDFPGAPPGDLDRLALQARRRAISAVRGHARETVTLGDAHWRDIRCSVRPADGGGLDVRLAISGVAARSLASDALSGTAAALAALGAADAGAVIGDLRILAIDIEGRPRFVHPCGMPVDVAGHLPERTAGLAGRRCATLTLSDRASRGVYEDRSGAELARLITANGGILAHAEVLPDDGQRLATTVEVLARRGDIDLLVCTGGTGIGPRDITPETLLSLGIKPVPGIGELLRAQSANVVRSAWLSRTVAGTLGHMMVIALPGSHKAVVECMEILMPLLPHTLSMLHGGDHPAGARAC